MLAVLDYSLISVTQVEGLLHLSPNRINLELYLMCPLDGGIL